MQQYLIHHFQFGVKKLRGAKTKLVVTTVHRDCIADYSLSDHFYCWPFQSCACNTAAASPKHQIKNL